MSNLLEQPMERRTALKAIGAGVLSLADMLKAEPRSSLEKVRRFLISHGNPAYVYASGAGLDGEIKIGAGVAKFLADIPKNGINYNELRTNAPDEIRWIRELESLGLVNEIGPGLYARTEIANRADYRYERIPTREYTLG